MTAVLQCYMMPIHVCISIEKKIKVLHCSFIYVSVYGLVFCVGGERLLCCGIF